MSILKPSQAIKDLKVDFVSVMSKNKTSNLSLWWNACKEILWQLRQIMICINWSSNYLWFCYLYSIHIKTFTLGKISHDRTSKLVFKSWRCCPVGPYAYILERLDVIEAQITKSTTEGSELGEGKFREQLHSPHQNNMPDGAVERSM